MKTSDGNSLPHYMDLVTDQDLWGAFRKVHHLHNLTQRYLALCLLQQRQYPEHDFVVEMELFLLRLELLQEL
ncbi:MAG: hypothetical protein ACFB10_07930 [Salibacteraceae bacterium]